MMTGWGVGSCGVRERSDSHESGEFVNQSVLRVMGVYQDSEMVAWPHVIVLFSAQIFQSNELVLLSLILVEEPNAV